MKLLVSNTRARQAFFEEEGLALVLRFGAWIAALVALTVLVPEEGLHWLMFVPTGELDGLVRFPMRFAPTASLSEVLLSVPVLWLVSLLPLVLGVEVWTALRAPTGTVHVKGTLYFAFLTLGASVLMGYGLPCAYAYYVDPSQHVTDFPYLLLGAGAFVWLFLLKARTLVAGT